MNKNDLTNVKTIIKRCFRSENNELKLVYDNTTSVLIICNKDNIRLKVFEKIGLTNIKEIMSTINSDEIFQYYGTDGITLTCRF